MKVVIMAGGEGVRLKPLTILRPKPMVPVCNLPLMEHILKLLKKNGFNEMVATLYYLPEMIQFYFEDGSKWGVDLSYVLEDTPLGTAGSVKKAVSSWKETFIVISGDVLTDINLREAYAFHKKVKASATLILTRVPNPTEFGVIIINEKNEIVRFLEKPGWGEVFSDTINTGIYILEPHIFDGYPENTPFDFSKELFPELLRNGSPIYGFVSSGYWCDVGNTDLYLQCNLDALERKIAMDCLFKEEKNGLRLGEDVSVSQSATISGNVLIGDNVKIGEGVQIVGPVVIGDSSIIEDNSKIKRSVIFPNAYVGKNTEIVGSIIGSYTSINKNCIVLEDSVLADRVMVGEGVQVNSGIKVWPNKTIEPLSTVTSSIILGSHWKKTLFGKQGVKGIVNVEISPEFSSKLGSALGSILPIKSNIALSRDSSPASRMVKRAFLTGLLSTGVNVFDIRSLPAPIPRFVGKELNVKGGAHIRTDTEERKVQIEIFDEYGINIKQDIERKIESIYFREELRRVPLEDVGAIDFPPHIIEYYINGLSKIIIKPEILKKSKYRIVFDTGSYDFANILSTLCDQFEIECFNLKSTEMNYDKVSKFVKDNSLDMGIIFTRDGESLLLIDKNGNILKGDDLFSVFSYAICKAKNGATIALPVSVSRTTEKIINNFSGRVIRTKTLPQGLTSIDIRQCDLLCGEEGMAIPKFQIALDAIATGFSFLEHLSMVGESLEEIRSKIEPCLVEKEVIPLPWGAKASVMRFLIESHMNEKVEFIEGIKIFKKKGWVLIIPQPDNPALEIYAEGTSFEESRSLLEEYKDLVKSLPETK